MQGDFSRLTFDPARHYSAVLAQQGRVTLDADLNEGTLALLHYVRTVVTDLVGPVGYPRLGPGGFLVGLEAKQHQYPDLTITAGRMYVDGILVENEAAATYWEQPDGHLDSDVPADRLPTALPYLIYLRVWERLITAFEDPDIREIALGDLAPDTATRTRVVWQVAATATPEITQGAPTPAAALAWLRQHFGRSDAPALPRLRARATRPPDADDNPCDVAPEARYRGPENQLYRVEIHAGGPVGAGGEQSRDRAAEHQTAGAPAVGGPTFKFSRDNASNVYPVASIAGNHVELADLGRDGKLGLEVGDRVEIVDDAYASRVADDVQAAPAPALRRVKAIDPADRLVTLDDDTPGASTGACPPGTDAGLHPLLRRWDHRSTTRAEGKEPLAVSADGALPVVEQVWIDLEDGVQVYFEPSTAIGGRRYRRGDHWLIPARTIPGDVLWPEDGPGPAARPPDGVAYHYAPLAWVDSAGAADLRVAFPPEDPQQVLADEEKTSVPAPQKATKAAPRRSTPGG